MNRLQTATTAFGGIRVLSGAGFAATPKLVGRPWLGEDAARPATWVAVRGLGARDAALGGGTIAAAIGGESVPVWLAATLASDLVDLVATLASRRDLPRVGVRATVAIAGAAVLGGGGLIVAWTRA